MLMFDTHGRCGTIRARARANRAATPSSERPAAVPCGTRRCRSGILYNLNHHHAVSSGLSCSHGLLSILATLRLIWASQYHTLTQPWLCPRLGRPCMAPCEQRHSVGRFRRSFHPKRRLIGRRYRHVARWAGRRGAQHTCGAGGVGAGRMIRTDRIAFVIIDSLRFPSYTGRATSAASSRAAAMPSATSE